MTITAESFGAIGDASTDDTNAIEAAFNAAGELGQTLVLENGKIYRITRTIEVAAKNVSAMVIGGNSWKASLYVTNASCVIFFDGTEGDPAINFVDHGGNNEQSVGHRLVGVTFVGGHIRFGDYNTHNLVSENAIVSRTYGWMIGGLGTDVSDFTSITDGALRFTRDGVDFNLTGMDFTTCTSMQDVARVIDDVGFLNDLMCRFVAGRIVIITGENTLVDATPASGTQLNTILKIDSGNRAGNYQGSKMCSKGIDLYEHNFNTLLEKNCFLDIDGTNVHIGTSNGNTKVKGNWFNNRASGIACGVISTQHDMIYNSNGNVGIEISGNDFEPMIADSLVRTGSTNKLRINDNYMELPNVLSTSVNDFIVIGDSNGTPHSVEIVGNFANCKEFVSKFVRLEYCARGFYMARNEALNFEYGLHVNTTAGAVVDDVIYDGVQAFDSSGTTLIAQISGAAEKVDTKGTVPIVATPILQSATGSFAAITYDANTSGWYTRNGRDIQWQGFMQTDAITLGTAAGNVTIPLPVPRGSSPSGLAGTGFAGFNSVAAWAVDQPLYGIVNNTAMGLRKRTTINGADAPITVVDLALTGNKNILAWTANYICAVNV